MNTSLYGQQDTKFTLFNYNYTLINPAAAGSKEKISLVALHRRQWVGIKTAPVTSSVCVDMPLLRIRSAVALNVMNESMGITKSTFVGVSYSVIARLSTYSRFSGGIQMGVNEMKTNFSDANTDPTNSSLSTDPALNNGANINRYAMQTGLGVYYYDSKFKIGLSIPTLNPYTYFGAGEGTKQSHFYLISGMNFSINNSVLYNPRLLVKFTAHAPVQVDLYNQFIISEKLALGVTFRSSEAVAAVVAYTFHRQFNIAYSYDAVVLNKLRPSQAGSHDIAIAYLLPLKMFELQHTKIRAGRKRKCIDYDSKARTRLYKDIENIFYDKN
ncbi:MAG: PorP/SprF family type IX secretion system membrane protein [Opitutaceae bacterium]|nr:PorP/SprF family type IX secretion system membrane protein [Cytophagales bacterium]